jgi:predicted DNA-binding WGR domain protein
MKPIRLESIDPDKNRARYYVLHVSKTLWNTWALARWWGRIDQEARGVRMDECATEEEALQRAAETIDLRMRHKYVVK